MSRELTASIKSHQSLKLASLVIVIIYISFTGLNSSTLTYILASQLSSMDIDLDFHKKYIMQMSGTASTISTKPSKPNVKKINVTPFEEDDYDGIEINFSNFKKKNGR